MTVRKIARWKYKKWMILTIALKSWLKKVIHSSATHLLPMDQASNWTLGSKLVKQAVSLLILWSLYQNCQQVVKINLISRTMKLLYRTLWKSTTGKIMKSTMFQFTKFVLSYEDYCLVTPPPAHNIFSNLLHIPTHGMAFNLVRHRHWIRLYPWASKLLLPKW